MFLRLREIIGQAQNEKGFTLVELIVVMAILAVLAAIAIPRFGASLTRSRQQAHNSNVKMIEQAAELAYTNAPTADINITYLVTNKYLSETPKTPVAVKAAECPNCALDHAAGSDYSVTVANQNVGGIDQLIITVEPGYVSGW